MQKYISLFFSVLLFAACKQAATTPPNIIEEKKMIKLLIDMHLTDGELYTLTPMPDTLYKYGREKYISLFKSYHTTEKQYDESYKFYSQDPVKIQAIYDEVDKVLKAKLDSIRNAKPKQGQSGANKPAVVNMATPNAATTQEVDTVLQKKKIKEGLDSLAKSTKKRIFHSAKKPETTNAIP